MALVKAANDIVIAAKPTQMPVFAGSPERSLRDRGLA